jgi:hypothetical protein
MPEFRHFSRTRVNDLLLLAHAKKQDFRVLLYQPNISKETKNYSMLELWTHFSKGIGVSPIKKLKELGRNLS